MKSRTVITITIICAAAAWFATTVGNVDAQTAAVASTGGHSFAVDPVHSSVMFRINHLGVANFYGSFNEISGSYDYDPANPEKSKFDVAVQTNSVDTRNSGRDDHLKSPDFFNAAEYPVISFKSTKVEKIDDGKLNVAGDLNLHGVTKSITVEMKMTEPKETFQGFKGGCEGMISIIRTDFGMDTYVAEGALGDKVEIVVSLEGKRK